MPSSHLTDPTSAKPFGSGNVFLYFLDGRTEVMRNVRRESDGMKGGEGGMMGGMSRNEPGGHGQLAYSTEAGIIFHKRD